MPALVRISLVVGLRLFERVVNRERDSRIVKLPHLGERFAKTVLKERLRCLLASSMPERGGDQFLHLWRQDGSKERWILLHQGTAQPHVEEVAQICISDIVVIGRIGGYRRRLFDNCCAKLLDSPCNPYWQVVDDLANRFGCSRNFPTSTR